MKQILLLSTLIVPLSLTTFSQIKKGALLLGGYFSYSDIKTEYKTAQPGQKRKYADFNISAGTALKENVVLGLSLGFGHTNQDYNYTGISYVNSKSDRYNFTVFYRQYKKLAKDFYFFGELGGGYIGSNQTDTDIPGNIKTKYTLSGAELYLTPGISYRIYKKLQVELLIPQIGAINYSVLNTKSPVIDSKEDHFGFNTNLSSSFLSSLALGFRFVL